MKTASPSRGSRLGLRVLITLALVAFVVIILIFYLSQPVAAPGDEEPTAEVTPDAAETGFSLPSAIVFMSDRDGDWDIYTASTPTEAVNLSANDANDGFPSYSLDTVQISYVSSGTETGEIGGYLMGAGGANQVPAAADLGTFMDILLNGRGDWDRRDGLSGFTLISLRDLNLEVYYQGNGEESARNLTGNGAIDWYAHLAPDGTRIAFASDRVDVQHDIYVIGTDGATLTRLTDDPANDWSPIWSADGTRVIFASERARVFGGGLDLYTLDLTAPTGGEIAPAVPFDPESTFVSAGITFEGYTVYMSNESGNWEIYVSAPDGAILNLSSSPADDLFAVWKPRVSALAAE